MSCVHNLEYSVTAKLDNLVAMRALGLRDNDFMVMAAFVEVAVLDVSDARVKISCWEVAKRTKLHLTAVKRSIAKLIQLQLLARRQDVKAAGETAWTQVSRAACALMGVDGGAMIAGLPPELQSALAGELVSVCRDVAQAWKACEPMPVSVESAWLSGVGRLDRVRSMLCTRSHLASEKVLEAHQARVDQLAEEGKGVVRISCPGGSQVVVDALKLDSMVSCPADVGFGRDVLHELAVRHPELVTPTSVPRLLAEILYSRSVGFLSGREYTPAVRILASCIGGEKKPWGRPRGMWPEWYDASTFACAVSTGGSVLVH